MFPTDLTTSLMKGKNNATEDAFPPDQIPAERAGLPEDVMGQLLYLAPRAGAYGNANYVITDGGRLSVYWMVWLVQASGYCKSNESIDDGKPLCSLATGTVKVLSI